MLADHHAPGMLAKVARQILHCLIELKKVFDERLSQIQAGVVKLALG